MIIRKTFILLILLFSIFLSGCLYTFYPIFTEKDIVFNKELLGFWNYGDSSKNGLFEFRRISETEKKELSGNISKLSDKGYFVVWRDKKKQVNSAYFVFLVKIGTHYYFDFFPSVSNNQIYVDDLFRYHFVTLHCPYKIILHDKDHFELKQLEESFLDKLIENKQIQIRYLDRSEPNGGRVILSPTAELQQFLTKYGDNEKAYNKDNSYYCTHLHNK
ncbi:MAG TPA: hypothetical protein VFW07_12680 [Parafilimonas sp.]|nr:hypothetical protein [Parafilimonas sp.]